jgi:hypothetical protein
MSEPLAGLVVLEEHLDPIEADLVIAALTSRGIKASIVSDPRHGLMGRGLLGPTRGTDPIIEVVVRVEDEAAAREALDAVVEDLPPEFHHDEILDWSAAIDDRHRHVRARRRTIVLACILVLFATVVITLVIGGVASVL